MTKGAGYRPRIDLHHQDVCLPWSTKALAALCIATSGSIALANLTATRGRTRFLWSEWSNARLLTGCKFHSSTQPLEI